ncbi:MAG: hypothetical protein E7314_07100 [Clostridiales bacterium]|nr:hypothetical protein [Clostridiales bacterium]
MKKDDKILLWVIAIMLIIINPSLIVLGLIGLVVYAKYKENNSVSKIKQAIKNKDKAHNYEVIDTTAEVIDSQVVKESEWKATKEYRH